MSDLAAVRRRMEVLQGMKQQIDGELGQLEVAEGVLLRLAEAEDSTGPAVISMNLTTDLEGKSAAEAARFILRGVDAKNEGMHYQDILAKAVRLGYMRNQEASPDTMRRALSKRDDWFQPLGDGVFRLK